MTVVLILARCAGRKQRFQRAQAYLDSECLRLMTPIVPVAKKRFDNAGKLRDSGQIAEPGKIIYTAPFARSDYYANKRHKPPHGGNPLGERMWFEVMKQRHSATLLRGTAAIIGGKAKK